MLITNTGIYMGNVEVAYRLHGNGLLKQYHQMIRIPVQRNISPIEKVSFSCTICCQNLDWQRSQRHRDQCSDMNGSRVLIAVVRDGHRLEPAEIGEEVLGHPLDA